MISEIERRAQLTIAGACSHLSQENHSDAVSVVNLFLNDYVNEEFSLKEALEVLARAGIIVSMRAAQPEPREVFDQIIWDLVASESV